MNKSISSVRVRPLQKPSWGGPVQEGVSQSMLCEYLICLERFRVSTIDGIGTPEGFNLYIEFGQMWHICEEYFAANEDWEKPLLEYSGQLMAKYRGDGNQISKWYNVVKLLFPLYMKYWEEQEDVQNREPIFQEEVFLVDYKLPSGRVVKLKGKWDAVDHIVGEGLFLQENKTKSTVDEEAITAMLQNDIQTKMYTIALKTYQQQDQDLIPKDIPIKGVRYNVIRRPLGGGKGSIRPKKGSKNVAPETMPEFYERLTEVIKDDIDGYFYRWKVEFSEEDITRFQKETLDPLLENLCDDYEWWEYAQEAKVDPYDYLTRTDKFPYHMKRHFRLPYGTYNVVQRGGVTDLDNYINTGSTVGLCNINQYFPELQ